MKKFIALATLATCLFGFSISASAADLILEPVNSSTEATDNTESTNIGNGITSTEENEPGTTTESPDVFYEDENGDLVFNDEALPSVEPKTFFQKIYNKLFGTATVAQKVGAIVILIFFIADFVMIIFSFFFNRQKIWWYIGGLLICSACFVAIIYAKEIIYSFSRWFVE